MNSTKVWILIVIAILLFIVALPMRLDASQIPHAMQQHKSVLVRIARQEHGMYATIPLFAALVHQESSGNCRAQSAYAQGCTQFTPDTAAWAATRWKDLRPANVFNPAWSFRAAIRYLDFLDARVAFPDRCERMAGSLSAYNGGLGNLRKDIKLSGGLNYWFGGVENFSGRAAWAFHENREYPIKILHEHQSTYRKWGGKLVCH